MESKWLKGGAIMDLHHFLEMIIPILVSLIEIVGVLVVVYGVGRSILLFILAGGDLMVSDPKLDLAKALAYSLEFKLAAEILKSVVVHTLDEFINLAAIVLLRVILTFVIHWEIESSEKSAAIEHKNLGQRFKKKGN